MTEVTTVTQYKESFAIEVVKYVVKYMKYQWISRPSESIIRLSFYNSNASLANHPSHFQLYTIINIEYGKCSE